MNNSNSFHFYWIHMQQNPDILQESGNSFGKKLDKSFKNNYNQRENYEK